MVGRLRARQPAVRRAGRRGWPPRTPRCGCRTTSSSWCRRCCATCGPTCGSASTCTSRSRRRSCSSSCRGAGRSSRACSAPTWSASSSPAAPRTSSGWSGSASATRPTATRSSCPTAGWCAPRRSRSRSTPAAFEELARSEEVQKRSEEIRQQLGNPRKVFLGIDRLDYTKGIYARLRAFAELIADGHVDVEDAVFVQVATPSRERVEQYRHPPRRHRPAGRPDQRRPRPDRPSGDQLPALVLPAARRWPRSTAPPTSWS